MFPLDGPHHSCEVENSPCGSPCHSPQLKSAVALHHGQLVPGKQKDLTHEAVYHGQLGPGKGKDLTNGLPIQLHRACIHLYGWP